MFGRWSFAGGALLRAHLRKAPSPLIYSEHLEA